MANQGVGVWCCTRYCGDLVPVPPSSNYRSRDGRDIIPFNLVTGRDEPAKCGIPVTNVIQGNLEGLVGRDDLAGLNPNADSIRFKIEVGNPSISWSLN